MLSRQYGYMCAMLCVAVVGRSGKDSRQAGVREDVGGGALQRRLGPNGSAHLSGHADAGQPLPHAQRLPGHTLRRGINRIL